MKFTKQKFYSAAALAALLTAFAPPAAPMGHREPKIPVAANDAANEPPKDSAAPAAEKPAEPAPPAKKIPSGNPLSGNADAIDVGTRLYFNWCVQCHGQKANGDSRFGAYAGNLTTFWRGYKEFIKIVLNGRTGNLGSMPAWKDYMDEDTIAKIGAFLETRAVEGANWQ
jgi:cytochrome c oxidase cbb3-type subunit III